MPLRKNTKVELIRSVPLFSGCSKRELAEIASMADELDFPEGKTLIKEGERGREFLVLIEGTVDVNRKGRKLPPLGRADCIGEIALVLDVPRTATVTTTSPVRALVLTDQSFRSLLKRSPQIQLKVIQSLAERLAPEVI
ncbi:MAG TPA: cyclic nucleotide-binding domain-containing protein [Actinomycetota bacterium]|nr:cyclic nucleotide-binding domain-containing protein [Actinomycetota bacterium]